MIADWARAGSNSNFCINPGAYSVCAGKFPQSLGLACDILNSLFLIPDKKLKIIF
jgi:hypothetical protein